MSSSRAKRKKNLLATPEEKAQALADFKRGDTLAEIGLRHGRAPGTISYWAQSAGLPHRTRGTRRKSIPSGKVRSILKDLEEGKLSVPEIAWNHGRITRARVYAVRKQWQHWQAASHPEAPYQVGDIVRWNDRIWKLLTVDPFGGMGQDVMTGQKVRVAWRITEGRDKTRKLHRVVKM